MSSHDNHPVRITFTDKVCTHGSGLDWYQLITWLQEDQYVCTWEGQGGLADSAGSISLAEYITE